MEILDGGDEPSLPAPAEGHLAQDVEGPESDRLGVEPAEGGRPLRHPEQLEQVGRRGLRVHGEGRHGPA